MHKSRLAGFIIDCNTGDIDAAATFWAQALGYKLARVEGDPGIYRGFDTGPQTLVKGLIVLAVVVAVGVRAGQETRR